MPADMWRPAQRKYQCFEVGPVRQSCAAYRGLARNWLQSSVAVHLADDCDAFCQCNLSLWSIYEAVLHL